ncbi:single-stranded DNA-binding protein [Nocardiopsis mangrovi]|uniref:Single-stranded DNA-binding protein n=1 Tax=Nocardiopsis mangrovi TaxID=1179818 RepID=A0ABV9E2E3_9ACTN
MHNPPFASASVTAATATAVPPPSEPESERTARAVGGRAHDSTGHRNDVMLAGRVTAEPAVRELPSGDHLVTWRISITRPPAERRPNQPADPITCVSFLESMQDATRGWRIGDIVGVHGSLRRRFWRTPGGSTSVIEVEARSVEWMGRMGEPQ